MFNHCNCLSDENFSADDDVNGDDVGVEKECDYDKNVTRLYHSIETRAWIPVLEFLQTGKWPDAMIALLMHTDHHRPPAKQVRIWVTKYDPLHNVKWSQLPIHAAIRYGAPKKIIETLLELYPFSVRISNDRKRLPLHLAMKFGAPDTIVNVLLQAYPEGLFEKCDRGEYPYEVQGAPRTEYMSTLRLVVKATTSRNQQQHMYTQIDQNLQDEVEKNKFVQEITDVRYQLQQLQIVNKMLEEDLITKQYQYPQRHQPSYQHGTTNNTDEATVDTDGAIVEEEVDTFISMLEGRDPKSRSSSERRPIIAATVQKQ